MPQNYKSTLREKLSDVNWDDLYNENNLDFKVNTFDQHVNQILNEIAPFKTIQVRNKYAVWLSEETILKMEEWDKVCKEIIRPGPVNRQKERLNS